MNNAGHYSALGMERGARLLVQFANFGVQAVLWNYDDDFISTHTSTGEIEENQVSRFDDEKRT